MTHLAQTCLKIQPIVMCIPDNSNDSNVTSLSNRNPALIQVCNCETWESLSQVIGVADPLPWHRSFIFSLHPCIYSTFQVI